MGNKYTLITGASRGIGEAIAKYCASKKYNLILVARTKEKLEELAYNLIEEYEVTVQTFVADLTDPDIAVKLFNWCKANNLHVNMLINNAGIGLYGKFDELSITEQLAVIQLNQVATVSMTHQFIPMLKENKESYLLNVASTACYQPIPYMSVYAASQSFLQSFTLAIRNELKIYNINVSCLCPGPTATDFFERAGLENLPVNSSEIKMNSKEVAETAIEGLLDHESEIIPGTNNTIGAYFSKLFPNKFIVKTVSNLFAPKL
jgi:short-subunit dehydrogenase